MITPDQSLEVFKELINCGITLYYWKYTEDGTLIDTTCRNYLLNKFFMEHDVLPTILTYPGHMNSPMVLSGEYGIQWCASIEITEAGQKYLHVIGPSFTSGFSSSDVSEMLKNANIPLTSRTRLSEAMNSIPVIGNVLLYQYSLMLHCCVTGQIMQRNQILSITVTPKTSTYYAEIQKHISAPHPTSQKKGVNRRRKTYEFERKLLNNVREGNPDYEKDLLTAGLISDGVNLSPNDPVLNYRTNGIVFITLCTRAAIEGGLAPDISYTIGDSYIDKVNHSRRSGEVKQLLDEMYKTFIMEVHFIKQNEGISHQILDIMKYIDNYPGEDLSLHALAKRIGYAGEHLSRKFKAETGQTISAYIRNVRIEKSKELLSTSELHISEIANAVGFSSSSLFASYFMKLVGMSPSQYREKHYYL